MGQMFSLGVFSAEQFLVEKVEPFEKEMRNVNCFFFLRQQMMITVGAKFSPNTTNADQG